MVDCGGLMFGIWTNTKDSRKKMQENSRPSCDFTHLSCSMWFLSLCCCNEGLKLPHCQSNAWCEFFLMATRMNQSCMNTFSGSLNLWATKYLYPSVLLSMSDFLYADKAIQQHVTTADWFQSSKRICAYISCTSLMEVATAIIVAQALKQG